MAEVLLGDSSPQKVVVSPTSSVQIEAVEIPVHAGWNMISLPGYPLDTDPGALKGQDSALILPLYRWDPAQFTYKSVTELKFGEGYWALCLSPEGEKLELVVVPTAKYQASLKPGWNMIGGVNQSADFSSPADEPEGSIVPNTLYRWQGDRFTYMPAQSIEPGQGYWVLTLTPCLLTIDAAALAAPMAGVKPVSWQLPMGVKTEQQEKTVWLSFDSRASEGFDDLDRFIPPASPTESGLEAYLVGGQYRLRRDVQPMSAQTFSWRIRLSSPEPVQLTIDSQEILIGQELVVSDGQMETVLSVGMEMRLASGERELTVTLRPLSKVTQLLQNYPNPFNPETWIPFELNQDSDVSLTIYDTVGRQIQRMDLGFQPAGTYLQRDHAIYWDGRNQSGEMVSSGVYFYTVYFGDNSLGKSMTETKLMLMLK